MRVIRLKIKDEVKDVLLEISTQFKTGDRGFVEDLYSLLRLKGNGLPTKQRADKLTEHISKGAKIGPVTARIMVNKRVQVLKQFIGMAYFRALTSMQNPIEATRRLLVNFQKLYLKYREAQCKTCPLMPQCEFGKQYGDATVDITRVIDPDFKKKAHDDCPVLPQIEVTFQMSEAMAHLKNMVKNQQAEAEVADLDEAEDLANNEEAAEEMSNSLDADDDLTEDSFAEPMDFPKIADPNDTGKGRNFGPKTRYTGSHDGSQYVKSFEDMVENLSLSQLVIFEIGRKFDQTLFAEKKGNFAPTEEMSDDKKEQRIAGEQDIPKLQTVQHGLPEETFEKRLGDKSLLKTQDLKAGKKKKLLYLLIDNSGSMTTLLHANRYGTLTRGSLAATFGMSLSRRVRDDEGIVFCRFFDSSPSYRMKARERDEFDTLMKQMAHASFNGMSTNVLAAVTQAVKDIQEASKQDELSKSEIILISDCEDSFDAAAIKAALNGQPLNVLDVVGEINRSNVFRFDGSKALKAASTAYYKVNPQNINIDKIVEIV